MLAPPDAVRRSHAEVWSHQLRIAATLAVVTLHVASASVLDGGRTVDWWVANVVDAACRWAVPVFFLLSGHALLSPRPPEALTTYFRKRVVRVVVPFLVWSSVYAAMRVARMTRSGDLPSVEDVVSWWVRGDVHYHLWFVYALLPLYALVPALRPLVGKASTGLGLGVASVMGAGAACAFAWVAPDRVVIGPAPSWWAAYLPFFVAGPFLGRLDPTAGRRVAWAALGVGIAVTVAGCGAWFPVDRTWGLWFYGYLTPHVALTAAAAFHLARGWVNPVLAPATLSRLGEATFGVYLLHPLVLLAFRSIGGRWEEWPAAAGIPMTSALALAVSFGVVDTLRRSQVLRRVV